MNLIELNEFAPFSVSPRLVIKFFLGTTIKPEYKNIFIALCNDQEVNRSPRLSFLCMVLTLLYKDFPYSFVINLSASGSLIYSILKSIEFQARFQVAQPQIEPAVEKK